MKRQVSAGAVIFRRDHDGHIRFLLLYRGRGNWNSPKGRIEEGEHATAAFFREVEEETGLKRHDLRVIPNFREENRYVFSVSEPSTRGTRRVIFKTDLFYLAEAQRSEVELSKEHKGFGWFTYHEAMEIVRQPSIRNVLARAYGVITHDLSRHKAHPARPGRHLRGHRPVHRPPPGLAPRGERAQPES